MLPHSAVPRERPRRSEPPAHPLAPGPTLPLQRRRQDVQRHARHGVSPPAHRGRDRAPRGDVARARLSAAGHRRGVGLRRADGEAVEGARRWARPRGAGASRRTTPGPRTRASRCAPRPATGRHRVEGAGHDGPNTLGAWRGRQRAARPATAPAPARAGPPRGRPPSAVGLYRGGGQLSPGDARNLARSRAHGPGGAAPTAALAPCLPGPRRQARRAAPGGRDRPPHSRWHPSPRGDAQTPVARGRREQDRGHGALARDVPGAPRAAGTPWPSAGTPPPNLARGPVLGRYGRELLSSTRASALRWRGHDTCHGRRDPGAWLGRASTAVVSWATASVDTAQAAWAALTRAETPDCAVVFIVTTVGCRATAWLATRAQGIETKGLTFPRRHRALGRAAHIAPARLVERRLQCRPIALAVAQQHYLCPLGEARAYQVDQSDMQLLGKMPLRALPHAPRQRQGTPLIDDWEHQRHTATADDTAIHHQHERLEGSMQQ
jgi:hypothetical protein